MNELIKVTTNENDEQLVSARDLHKGLEIKTRFSQWVTQNFKNFRDGIDYSSVVTTTRQNQYGGIKQIKDYAITTEMAKHIAMMTGTEKGFEIRDYFIKVEKAWNNPEMVVQRALQIQTRKVDALRLENEQMKPKADYFDDLVKRNLLTNFRDTAKELHIKQKKFIDWLLDHKYVYRDKHRQLKHYAKYDNDLFEFKEFASEWTDKAHLQSLITPKGRATFKLLLERDSFNG